MAWIPPRWSSRLSGVTRTLWFVPLAIALAGAALGLLMPFVDALDSVEEFLGDHSSWTGVLLAATPDGARQLLGTSAGSLATILGVAFSLTLVALQLAAQQYTPRMIGRLMDDRLTKVVLGCYLGTIAYLLLVLRVVHGSGRDLDRFVPWLSITLGVLLILFCLALLSVFINNLARSMQATSVVARVARGAIQRIRDGELASPAEVQPAPPDAAPVWLEAKEHGYVQVIDVQKIARVAPRGTTFLQVEVATGDFVFAGQRIAAVWPARVLEEQEIRRLHEAFVTGEARTPDQDIMLAVQQLSDVALKALSPSMNDETTAILAANELGAIGVELGRACVPRDGYSRSEHDGVIVVAPLLGMRRYMREAFQEVIRNAGSHPRVLRRVVEILVAVAAAARGESARSAVMEARGWVADSLSGIPPSGRLSIERRLLNLGAAGGDAADVARGVH